jgi:hypothetical protein
LAQHVCCSGRTLFLNHQNESKLKQLNLSVTLLLVAWMMLVALVFALVTLPSEGRFYPILPSGFWRLRELILPFFYSPSIY